MIQINQIKKTSDADKTNPDTSDLTEDTDVNAKMTEIENT